MNRASLARAELIDRINQIFSADLGPETMLTIEQVQEKMVANETLVKQARANFAKLRERTSSRLPACSTRLRTRSTSRTRTRSLTAPQLEPSST